MPSPPTTLAPLPPPFLSLKHRIQTSLSTPASAYTDASPKGSLDTALVPLITRLNALFPGAVTTSSCAGRVSVFLEGRKKARQSGGGEGVEGGGGEDGEDERGSRYKGEEGEDQGRKSKSVPGGKGMGGRWLFVSHDAVDVPGVGEREPLTALFGLTRMGKERGSVDRSERPHARYVRFAFEPMILHIATASLAHAAPILSAAISAGFRESGVQSLKNLTDPNAMPMVAVRSAGLAFESIIGVVREAAPASDGSTNGAPEKERQDEVVIALVDEQYLEMLVEIANERFVANTERIRRFEEVLFKASNRREDEWEEKQVRQDRKRREGLRRKKELEIKMKCRDSSLQLVDEDPNVMLKDLEGIT